MTTSSTSAPLSMATNADFQAWVSEVITNLVTTCGLTQTTDTGQINTSSVTIPTAVDTSAGYVILTFNDTLQTATPTSPNITASVYIKLEFGTGQSTSTPYTGYNPAMWITVGTGSNGTGTLTGVVGTRMSITQSNNSVNSATTAYTSYYMYNKTLGVAGMVFKVGSTNPSDQSYGGFYIFRSNDGSGNPTGDSVNVIASNATNPNSGTFMNCISFISQLTYGGPWSFLPLSAYNASTYSTTYNGNTFVFPVFYQTPYYSISAYGAVGSVFNFSVGGTLSMTLIGSTPHTFLSTGQMFGTYSMAIGDYQNTSSFLMIWE